MEDRKQETDIRGFISVHSHSVRADFMENTFNDFLTRAKKRKIKHDGRWRRTDEQDDTTR